MVNPLLLSIADGGGGAARSAYRLHQGLQNIGLQSNLLVQTKTTDSKAVVGPKTKLNKGLAQLRPFINSLPLQLVSPVNSKTYSLQWLPDNITTKVNHIDPSIINLHWICDGFLSIESLRKFNRPLVWTLHDMWPFTGGCHYSGECNRYTNRCGTCPQLKSHRSYDFSSWVWQRKSKTYRSLNLTVVTPSRWLADCTRASSLLQKHRIEIIPNGLDLEVFKPIHSATARQILNLPPDQSLILFSAIQATNDHRKGFHFLYKALQYLKTLENQNNIQLVVMGASEPREVDHDLGYKIHYLGTLKDDYSIALAYAAANVFVAPSEQDNLPNTVLEAIACGTPCVAFNIGGMPDLIEHQINGYLAHPFEIKDLANGIKWVLENKERRMTLEVAARTKAEQEFSLEKQANCYQALFNELIETARCSQSPS